MTRLPKKRGITQADEDKSLILRSFFTGSARTDHQVRSSMAWTSSALLIRNGPKDLLRVIGLFG